MDKWDKRFVDIAETVSTWSTCVRRHCGAVLVRDKHIIATGYNGAPAGAQECINGRECIRLKYQVPSGERHELCYATHAEQNALVQAARFGIATEGATMYIFGGSPCIICSKLMINAGIRTIKYKGDYPDELSLSLLNEVGVEVIKLT